MRIASSFLIAAVLGGCATQGGAPEAITRPAAAVSAVQAPRAGDEWTYEGWISGRPEIRRRQVVRINEASAEQIVETHRLPEGRSRQAVHRPGAYVAGSGFPGMFAFSPYLPVFERVAQGAGWRGLPFRGLGPCNANPNWTCTFDARVASSERVVVAAGAFDTLRIEIEQKVTASEPTGRFRWHVQRKATFWYAPEVKRFVKASWRTVAGDWRGPDRDAELVSYKLN